MVACIYALLTLIAAAITIIIWKSGKCPSNHVPFDLPSDPEMITPKLVMLIVLIGYILCLLYTLGVFNNKDKHYSTITVPYYEPGQPKYFRAH